ncbi:MAG: OmpH family outer membrane protein [Alphaproteobacteria bacterium]
MKKIISIITVAIIAGLNIAAAEVNMLTESSIAIVDMQQIITGSNAAKALRDAAEKKSFDYEKEAKKLEEELNKNNQELSKQRSVLSEEAYAEKVREFENKIVEAQRNTQMKKIQLAQGFENALGEISQVVSEIVDNIAKEKQFTLVIPSTGLLYAKPNLDITNDVLSKLNSKLSKVELKLEQPQAVSSSQAGKSKDKK